MEQVLLPSTSNRHWSASLSFFLNVPDFSERIKTKTPLQIRIPRYTALGLYIGGEMTDSQTLKISQRKQNKISS